MTPTDKVLSIALAEVGYLEKRSNSQLDDPAANAGGRNYTKYARDLDRTSIFNTPKQGYDWCAVFYIWPFERAFGEEAARRMLHLPVKSCAAGVDWLARYFKEAGAFSTTPVIGGPIFFLNGKGQWQHVEMVTDYRGGVVYTVGGNTSGGRVAAKSYSDKDTSIGGYGRPDWAAAPADAETEEDDMLRYNTLAEIQAGAPWAYETVKWLCDHKYLTGNGGKKDGKGYPADLDLSRDMVRLLVMLKTGGAFKG